MSGRLKKEWEATEAILKRKSGRLMVTMTTAGLEEWWGFMIMKDHPCESQNSFQSGVAVFFDHIRDVLQHPELRQVAFMN